MLEIPFLTFKLLTLSWITAKRQLIHDRTASRNSWNQSYDFIIVGAGTAGCTIAERLTENPGVRVLLLEVGGAQSAIYNDIPAMVEYISQRRPDLQRMYYNEPQRYGNQFPERRIPEPRGRAVGGSSTHNGMYYNRGNRRIYDNWAEKYGAKGWSYKEVLPYFKKSENNTDLEIVRNNPGYHGTSGPVQISSIRAVPKVLSLLQNSLNELGLENTDINGRNQTGTMVIQESVGSNGLRSSNGNAYVDPNPHPNNLHLVTRALVYKILFNGSTAIGVEFARNDHPFRVYARKEVILTCGSINTPQLLMLSGIGPKQHLQRLGIPIILDLPVGNNYVNHPMVRIDSQILDPSLFFPIARLDVQSLDDLYYRQSGRLASVPTIGFYYPTSNQIDVNFPNVIVFAVINNRTVLDLTMNFVRVRSKGTVRLHSTSPYVAPRIDANFLADPNDVRDIMDGLRQVFYILEMSSIAPYVSPPSFESIGCPVCSNRPRYQCTEGLECFLRYWSYSGCHTCCSCRMGAVERDDVVVDPQLRIKNLSNIRVCDSSIFPEVPNSNINAATTMVGEKCAQIVKDYYNLN